MIIPIDKQYRDEVNKIIEAEWAGPIVISKGVSHDTRGYNGFISITDDKLTGYVLYRLEDKKCEIVVLQSLIENQGIGSSLIRAVIEVAKANRCSEVWLITTNDNIHAIRYYQKFGFELRAVHINAIDVSRKLKPSIPLLGNEQIPIKHEFEFCIPA